MFKKPLIVPVLLVTYLLVSGAALVYTMTRFQVPLIPWPLMYQSFMLIAPYQGDVSWNGDWLAEGQNLDGEWIPIALTPYFPAIRGEASVRMALRSFERPENSDLLYATYRELALLLLDQEQAKGNDFKHVRLWYRTWPRSPEGYRALDKEVFLLKKELVASVP